MRPYSVPKVDVADNRTRWQIDDQHFVSIDAGLAHTGAAIDGHKSGAAIGRGGDFMTMNPGGLFGYGRNLSRRHRIDETHVAVALIDYKQRLSVHSRCDHHETESWQQ